MCFGNVAANLLEAYRREQAPEADFDALDREAAAAPAGCDGVALDHAASEAAGRAVFRGGRSAAASRGHHVRSIYEGVAEALAQQVERLCGDERPRRVIAAGGAARSELWRTIKSQRLGVPVEPAACEEAACLGAARLAADAIAPR
jgi:sugar (pentulose or hexulose) kinase